jgi:solute carrier family 26 (sodium-independent sulfate anion transporter), member 11
LFQFHFATVLSPWIRRALVAGGFGGIQGVGEESHGLPYEVAPVVSYGYDKAHPDAKPTDEEALGSKHKSASSSRDEAAAGHTSLYPQDTPFFHFDLASAVRAAERGHSSEKEDLSLDAKD